MKKFLTSSIVASALFATAGLADISTTGTGEFLIAPQYFANNGFSTDLKLVNTSDKYSYIYRGVVREFFSSNEFDFIVVLSPLDVWTATIKKGDNDDDYWFVSSDDSNYKKRGNVMANMTEYTKSASGVRVPKNRTFEKGYVEFYPIAAYEDITGKPVPKEELDKKFDALVANDTTDAKLVKFNTDQASNTVGVAGFVTIKKDDYKAAMTLPMTGFNNVVKLTEVAKGETIGATKNTLPELYLATNGIDQVFNDIKVTETTIPYTNYGADDVAYFTFWNDHSGQNQDQVNDPDKGYQKRSFGYKVRNNSEEFIAKTTPVIDPDPFSGGDDPVKPTPVIKGITNEMGSILLKNIITEDGANGNEKFKEGIVKFTNITNLPTITNQQVNSQFTKTPRALVTYIRVVDVAGQPSYSWVYAPVTRGDIQ